MKTGVQILLRDYNFESKNKVIFYEEDILNIFPIVKHINPRATDAYNFYTTGQSKIQQVIIGRCLIVCCLTVDIFFLNNLYKQLLFDCLDLSPCGAFELLRKFGHYSIV